MKSNAKYVELTPALYDYMVRQRSEAADPILKSLRAETAALGDVSRMLISEEQGSFFTLLVRALAIRSAIEIGTFTGYSSICIARGLPSKGRLVCCDLSKTWTAIAQKYWKRTGVARKIRLKLAAAEDTLRKLGNQSFDFAFVDADKTNYDLYYELLLPRLRRNALIIFDNCLWGGKVILANHPDARALHALNQKIAKDPRIEAVLLPISDGLMICRKK